MIDSHCHLTSRSIAEQLGDVLSSCAQSGVDRMLTVATSLDDGPICCELAQQHAHVFASVGIHPHEAARYTDRDEVIETLRQQAQLPGVVALGEMGLDTHYPDPPMDDQQRVFAWQLELVQELPDLPIVIHNRKATDTTLAMIRESGLPGDRFDFHCFTGHSDEVRSILDIGAYVGFTGIVTFKSAQDVAKASDLVPLDRLLIETDSPYLTPEPHRKVRPNTPAYLPHIADFLASRRGMTRDELIEHTDANACRLFGLR